MKVSSAPEYNERFIFSITPRELVESGASSIHLLLSHSLRESRTFELYASLLKSRGSDAVFLPFEVNPEDNDRLSSLFLEFRSSEVLRTIMVSDPFKQRVQPHIDTFTDRARNARAVNLVSKLGLEVLGDNLDGIAFERGLKDIETVDLTDHSVLFFGCGGVSSAIAMSLASRLSAMGLVDVDSGKADALLMSLLPLNPDVYLVPCVGPRDLKQFNTLYNGTGLGKGETVNCSPLLDEESSDALLFIDAIYTPPTTRFLQQGRERGSRAINGLSHMLASTALHINMITGQEIMVTEVATDYYRLYGK